MASKTGSYLRKSDRQRILKDLREKGELEEASESIQNEAIEAAAIEEKNGNPQTSMEGEAYGTGCLSCGRDDDHANLLICETCEAEYHTYCLDPPLRAVPTGDWFCPECKARAEQFADDGLDALIDALSPVFTSRFGEICWAQGGVGFGWWPAFIYDPRWTVGNVRQLARKNLGKRHLTYFFECHDAPFAVLPTTKLTKWEDGLMDDFHLGKTAKGAGQKRTKNFRQALQAATLEAQKPIEMRMDWNHTDQPQILPSPQPKKRPSPRKRQQREISPIKSRPTLERAQKKPKRSKPRGFPLQPNTEDALHQTSSIRNLSMALEGLVASALNRRTINPIVEPSEDGPLFVKLLQKTSLPMEDSEGKPLATTDNNSNKPCRNVGFVKLPSLKSSTFEDVRTSMFQEEIPMTSNEWRFFVPGLGPVSLKQEQTLGPIYSFLRRTTMDKNLGDGTALQPLKIFLVENESSSTTSSANNAAHQNATEKESSSTTASADNTVQQNAIAKESSATATCADYEQYEDVIVIE